MYLTTTYPSPLGIITLACDHSGQHLVGLWLEGQKYYGAIGTTLVPTFFKPHHDPPICAATKKWLDKYFAGKNPALSTLSLAPLGSEFRQNVWHILRTIPYGTVITYGDIAKKIAAQMHRVHMSSRAVGAAVGHNPISIIIPCHRVIGSNGDLTGYAGGIQAKITLLKLEGADFSDKSL